MLFIPQFVCFSKCTTGEQNTDSKSMQATTQHLIKMIIFRFLGPWVEAWNTLINWDMGRWNVMEHSPTLTQRDPFFSNATSRGVFLLKDWTTEAPCSSNAFVASGRSRLHAWCNGLPPYCGVAQSRKRT